MSDPREEDWGNSFLWALFALGFTGLVGAGIVALISCLAWLTW